jgi:hypothetical protein
MGVLIMAELNPNNPYWENINCGANMMDGDG